MTEEEDDGEGEINSGPSPCIEDRNEEGGKAVVRPAGPYMRGESGIVGRERPGGRDRGKMGFGPRGRGDEMGCG
jgi:hypothetical protein